MSCQYQLPVYSVYVCVVKFRIQNLHTHKSSHKKMVSRNLKTTVLYAMVFFKPQLKKKLNHLYQIQLVNTRFMLLIVVDVDDLGSMVMCQVRYQSQLFMQRN